MFSMRMRRRYLVLFLSLPSIYVDEEHNIKEEENENKNKEHNIHTVLRERRNVQENKKIEKYFFCVPRDVQSESMKNSLLLLLLSS